VIFVTEKVSCKVCGRKFESSEAMRQHYKDIHGKKEEIHEAHTKKKINFRTIGLYAVIILIVSGLGLVAYDLVFHAGIISENVGIVGSDRAHQDFKMYIQGFNNNLPIDFSQSKYQQRSKFAYFINSDGDVVHKHATGVTLGFFFKTLGMSITKDCITLDTSQKFCNDGTKVLTVYINNKTSDNFEKYELHDLDKILVTYGNWSDQEITGQLGSITNKAAETSAKEAGVLK